MGLQGNNKQGILSSKPRRDWDLTSGLLCHSWHSHAPQSGGTGTQASASSLFWGLGMPSPSPSHRCCCNNFFIFLGSREGFVNDSTAAHNSCRWTLPMLFCRGGAGSGEWGVWTSLYCCKHAYVVSMKELLTLPSHKWHDTQRGQHQQQPAAPPSTKLTQLQANPLRSGAHSTALPQPN